MKSDVDKLLFRAVQLFIRSYILLHKLMCVKLNATDYKVTDEEKSQLRNFLKVVLKREG